MKLIKTRIRTKMQRRVTSISSINRDVVGVALFRDPKIGNIYILCGEVKYSDKQKYRKLYKKSIYQHKNCILVKYKRP
jgi:myo-inositol-hexaphosphate 3-phosphohydrolase